MTYERYYFVSIIHEQGCEPKLSSKLKPNPKSVKFIYINLFCCLNICTVYLFSLVT